LREYVLESPGIDNDLPVERLSHEIEIGLKIVWLEPYCKDEQPMIAFRTASFFLNPKFIFKSFRGILKL
jgi:hypothetical protein